MDVTDAFVDLLGSTSWSDFQDRKSKLEAMAHQQALLYRRDTLLARPQDPWNPGPPAPTVQPPSLTPDLFQQDAAAVRAQRELMARRDALLAARQQPAPPASSAPPLNVKQEFFVRQVEFLYYLKTLDKLITQFDRENRFDLAGAVDRTVRALNETRTFAGLLREGVSLSVRLVPDLPRKVFLKLAQKTFIRYIHWRPALDLDK